MSSLGSLRCVSFLGTAPRTFPLALVMVLMILMSVSLVQTQKVLQVRLAVSPRQRSNSNSDEQVDELEDDNVDAELTQDISQALAQPAHVKVEKKEKSAKVEKKEKGVGSKKTVARSAISVPATKPDGKKTPADKFNDISVKEEETNHKLIDLKKARAMGEIQKAIQRTKAKAAVKEKEMELRSQEKIKKMELEYAFRIEEMKMRQVSMNPVLQNSGYAPSQLWSTNQPIAGPSSWSDSSPASAPSSLMDDFNDTAGTMEWDRSEH